MKVMSIDTRWERAEVEISVHVKIWCSVYPCYRLASSFFFFADIHRAGIAVDRIHRYIGKHYIYSKNVCSNFLTSWM